MNKYSGSNFDDFLKEEGILEEVSARAQKRLKELTMQSSPSGYLPKNFQSSNIAARSETSSG